LHTLYEEKDMKTEIVPKNQIQIPEDPNSELKELGSDLAKDSGLGIAEALTGVGGLGKKDVFQIGGRLFQGAIKYNFKEQLRREINYLREAGKIPEDKLSTKKIQSLTELLNFIDETDLEKERFEAVKSLFYAILESKNDSGEEILNYELF
jgi:hypothetical protein